MNHNARKVLNIVQIGVILTLLMALVSSMLTVPAKAAGETVSVWVTTGDKSKLLQQQGNVTFAADSGSNPTTIDVNENTTYQQMDGFGASMTDSSAWLIQNKMSASQRTTLMNNLFGSGGARLTFVRIPMSSTDFSIGNYTYDQTCCDVNDFSISHDTAYMIPVMQQARGIYSGLRIMGTPWTAPTWMKSSGAWGNGTLLSNYYGAYSQYFVKFIQAYQSNNLPIYAVTLQNEPHFEPGGYPGMRMEPTDQANFVKNNLGPAFSSAGLGTKIVVWDHNWDEPNYPINVLNDSAAKAYIYGSAFHCYAGAVGSQNQVHDAHPSKAVMFTECSGGAWATNFGDNLKWNMQNLLIGSTRAWATSVLLWNMALDTNYGPTNGGCSNCRGVVTIDQGNGNVTYNEEYYSLGHASRFVDPGAYRIASNSFSGDIENVAFKNPDGSKVVVAVNMGTAQKTFRIRWAGQYVDYTLPAGAVATFKWAGAGGSNPTNTPTRTNTPAGPTATFTRTATTGPTLTPTRTFTPGPTATRTNTPVAGSYYKVIARHSSKCLDVSGNSTGDGAWMQQWACTGATNQSFQFVPVSSTSYYQIIARNSNKCLDVQNGSTADGAIIQQWTCDVNNINQHFSLATVGSYINIISRLSNKCLDVQNVSTGDGAWIQQWTCGTGTNQQWTRTVVP